jgi:L-2-hydroxyglutarate oxidase
VHFLFLEGIMKSIAIIGGGIVGLACGYEKLRQKPGTHVRVFEKEKKVGQHQTGNNSGVLHCGLYYKPGSLKAKMAVGGIRKMVAFCQENQIQHEICGKLVVATKKSQLSRLEDLYHRGTANGLHGLRRVNEVEMREIEPHVAGIAGLHVPQEGIVDYEAVCKALVRKIEEMGGEVLVGAKVEKIRRVRNQWIIESRRNVSKVDFILNCAGLHCDRVSELAGEKRETRIVPFRGEYYKLKKEREYLVKHLIYPVPDPIYPFLGVHFTRLIHGGIEAGPNAVLAFAREGYRKRDINLRDLYDALSFSGFWNFAEKHVEMCFEELKRSFSKTLFCKSLQELVPDVRENDLEVGGSGVRAQAMRVDGTLVQDFEVIERPNALHILNAPSPAATASLAIAEEIVKRALQQTNPDMTLKAEISYSA